MNLFLETFSKYKLDISQISDVIKIIDSETFMRPIYAGNALATVKSKDSKKIITIRPTSFEPVSKEGGSATLEILTTQENTISTTYISREESSSDRPELRVGDDAVWDNERRSWAPNPKTDTVNKWNNYKNQAQTAGQGQTNLFGQSRGVSFGPGSSARGTINEEGQGDNRDFKKLYEELLKIHNASKK